MGASSETPGRVLLPGCSPLDQDGLGGWALLQLYLSAHKMLGEWLPYIMWLKAFILQRTELRPRGEDLAHSLRVSMWDTELPTVS